MLITTVDFPVRLAGVALATFERPDAVARAELCIWCPEALLRRLDTATGSVDGRRVPSPIASQALLSEARRVRDRFADLLARGGTLAVLMPPTPAGGVHTLQEVVDFDPLEVLPNLRVRSAALPPDGGPPRYERGQPFGEFFDRHGRLLAPGVALRDAPGRVIARTGTDAAAVPLACFAYLHPGRLLLLPGPAAGLDDAGRATLVGGLRTLARRLDPSGRAAASPDWAGDVEVPGERALRERVAALAQSSIDTARALATAREALARIDAARQLAVGDADAVRAALEPMLAALGAVPHPELAEPGALAFELGERAGLLVVDAQRDAPAHGVVARAHAAAARASRELATSVTPILVDVGENGLPPGVRTGPAAALAAAAREHGIALTTGQALLQVWAARDAAAFAALLDAGTPPQ